MHQARVSYSGGFTPGMNLTMGNNIPLVEFLGNLFSGFENLITLTNFKWNFKAFRSRIKHFNGA
jgi:hypothetical protein